LLPPTFHFVGPGFADPLMAIAASSALRDLSPAKNISRATDVSAKRMSR
jgi:hypothetical protein